MRLEGRGFPRPGYDIVHEGEVVGTVTSGTVSPSLGSGIAMGYVPVELAKPGTRLQIDLRGRPVDALVQRPPFYTGGSIKR
jgi:aminomethyltransferase